MHRAPNGRQARRLFPAVLFLFGLFALGGATCAGDRDAVRAIGEIQGRAHVSPWRGDVVTVRGVVTAVVDDAFVMQDDGDGDPATSDALFVAIDDPARFAGAAVTVTGTVSEVVPGGRETNLSTTTLVEATVDVTASDAVAPTAVVLGRGGRPIPDRVIDDDGMTSYDPDDDGLDFYESLEGMRVQVNAAAVISETSRHGELWILADGGMDASGRNARGGVTLTADDDNPERLQIDDDLFEGAMPRLAVGDRLESFVGILNYAYGNYEILPLAPVDFARLEARPAVATDPEDDGALTVATFNVLNLGGDADDAAFDARARVLVHALHAPALVALQEMQDDDGAQNSGSAAGAKTFARLIEAIERVGGPRYDFAQIDPVDGADGGQPGGNIRNGFVFDPARITLLDRRADGSPSPERLHPDDPAFRGSRVPLVASFAWKGERFVVVNVHLSSKGGSTPLFGAWRPPVNGNLEQRTAQATVLRSFVEEVQRNATERVVVLGDFNEFDWNEPLQVLTQGGVLRNLMLDLPVVERATYIYQGNAQALDHVLVSGFETAAVEIVHANTGRNDAASDHDPVLVRLR